MHELSLAENIIGIAVAEAQKHRSASVATVKVRLGDFAGVVEEALRFGFEIARRGTLAESAVLEIEQVPIRVWCTRCGLEDNSPLENLCLICPICSFPMELLSGREMQVEYVELDDASGEPSAEAGAGAAGSTG